MTTLNTPIASSPLDPRIETLTPIADTGFTLPSTGIRAGQQFIFLNQTANSSTIIVNASGGTEVGRIALGQLHLIALQDAPTLNTHWFIKSVAESGTTVTTFTFSSPATGTTTSLTMLWRRSDKSVVMYIPTARATVATANATVLKSDVAIPARLRPAQDIILPCFTDSAGTTGTAPGTALISTSTGFISISRDALATAWTNGTTLCGLGNSTTLSWHLA